PSLTHLSPAFAAATGSKRSKAPSLCAATRRRCRAVPRYIRRREDSLLRVAGAAGKGDPGATLAADAATVGLSEATWVAAGILAPLVSASSLANHEIPLRSTAIGKS